MSDDDDEEEECVELVTAANAQQAQHLNPKTFMCSGLCGSIHHTNDENYIVPLTKPKKQRSRKSSKQKQQRDRLLHLTEDPTVQESIECIFDSQLEEANQLLSETSLSVLPQKQEKELEKPSKGNTKPKHSTASDQNQNNALSLSPSSLDDQTRQLLQKSLSTVSTSTTSSGVSSSTTSSPIGEEGPSKAKITMQHVATYDPTIDVREPPTLRKTSTTGVTKNKDIPTTTTSDTIATASDKVSSSLCHCHSHKTPIVPPDQWPQGPIMVRPTPGSGMKIKGVRYTSSSEYLATPTSSQTWWDVIRQQDDNVNDNSNHKMCEECMLLPVNNGNESNEHTLVTDFQSPLFEGSLLLRIRDTPSAKTGQVEEDDPTHGYFHGMNRRYQAVIQGRFLEKEESLSMTDCVTGMSFYRKYGKLPPKWIVKGALKVIAFFAPQLDCQLDGPAPRSITPLGSTPQVLKVENNGGVGESLAAIQEEPIAAEETLLGKASDAPTSLTRARFRKKEFDKLYVSKSKHPLVDPTKVYTFEFLQHLVNFTELEIELGSFLGNLQLKEVLNGQPLQFMAGKHEEDSKKLSSAKNTLWAFDIWHEKLISTSLQYDDLPDKLH
eukprot:CAMPEP_0195308328 /NCGR_PEP_ID=MMETSP0707-20130614/38171_1 /TAXON_ID=33640 /ORGANISM="Asterionellopsis glacialis, Strain CCMP134" /LENGTH=606 /DNA_ID=CAMNT_0040372595 /DNA_START=15 /DNA_END=1835 /DNA_ORIENTATION=-